MFIAFVLGLYTFGVCMVGFGWERRTRDGVFVLREGPRGMETLGMLRVLEVKFRTLVAVLRC